eukprot:Lankesteria_metandrocarpae@DN5083_c0_g1_i2.p1
MLIFHHHMRGFGIIILVVHLYATIAKTTVFTGDKLQTFVKDGLPITKLSGDHYIAVDLHREGRRQYYHLKSRGDTIHVKQLFVLVRQQKSAVLKELESGRRKGGFFSRFSKAKKHDLRGGLPDTIKYVCLVSRILQRALRDGELLYTNKKSSANIVVAETNMDRQLYLQMQSIAMYAYEFPLFPKDVKNSNESFVVEYYTSHTGDEDEERDTYSKSVFYDSSKPIADDTVLQRIVKGKGFKKWLIKQSKDEHQDNIKTKIQPAAMMYLLESSGDAFQFSTFIEILCNYMSDEPVVMLVVSSSGAAQYYRIYKSMYELDRPKPQPFEEFTCSDNSNYDVDQVQHLFDFNFYSGTEGHAFLWLDHGDNISRLVKSFHQIADGVFLSNMYSCFTPRYPLIPAAYLKDSTLAAQYTHRFTIVDFVTSLTIDAIASKRWRCDKGITAGSRPVTWAN